MKKNDCIAKVKAYKYEYANNVNVHVKPTKTINSGALGRLYEDEVKLALGNCRFNHISHREEDTRKVVDGIIKMFEIKQGASELFYLDEKGNITRSLLKKDLIVCNPFYEYGDNVIMTSYIMPTSEYISMLEEIGLIRYKYSSSMYNMVKSGYIKEKYYDRITWQSYKGNLKKENQLYDYLEANAKPFKEWLEEQNIVPIEI